METFKDLDLASPIAKALLAMKFEKPTPIQAAGIPVALAGKDLIGVAQTGTGKTATFCIPILTRLLKNPGKTALILAPTRELAAQIEELWRGLTKYTPDHRAVVLIGGVAMQPQVRALRAHARVLIATPGRLVDHLQRGTVSLNSIEVLVLDEADRMLDMGFAPQLNQIMKYVPKQRQTLLFSATWSKEMDNLASKYLHHPEKVAVGNISRAAPKIAQFAIQTTQQAKNDLLLEELNARQGSVLVFARTQSRTDRVAKFLMSYGMLVNRIHGGRTQAQRTSALAAFKSGGVRVLIATDIAARGIDVADIAHVINFDLPQVAEDYIHRIGRTARAGTSGEALSFVAADERGQWRDIVQLLKKTGSSLPEMKGVTSSQLNPAEMSGGADASDRAAAKAGRPQRPSRGPRSERPNHRQDDRRDSRSEPRAEGPRTPRAPVASSGVKIVLGGGPRL
ncbi:MAG: DEAD/DEAH box helicase [Cryobacterium sp.]|nr:DEAD/DEAH box helicase [Oligoflexia bacterium]